MSQSDRKARSLNNKETKETSSRADRRRLMEIKDKQGLWGETGDRVKEGTTKEEAMVVVEILEVEEILEEEEILGGEEMGVQEEVLAADGIMVKIGGMMEEAGISLRNGTLGAQVTMPPHNLAIIHRIGISSIGDHPHPEALWVEEEW